MIVSFDIPSWMLDVIAERAMLTGQTPSDIVMAALDIRTSDIPAETVGWARVHGASKTRISRLSFHERSTVEAAAARYRTSREPGSDTL